MTPLDRAARDLEALTRTCYGEARGENFSGQIAVCWVVKNRVLRPGWWTRERGDGIEDDTIEAACLDPVQFSCWNPGDPNREIILEAPWTNPRLRSCLAAATCVYFDWISDPTHGSTHYHTTAVAPPWSRGKEPVVQFGTHQFFNNIS
jgi:spore germination cell wall hydrolase CwlJ-like protein